MVKSHTFAVRPPKRTRHQQAVHQGVSRLSFVNSCNVSLDVLLNEVRQASTQPDSSILNQILELTLALAERSTCTNAHRFLALSLALHEWMETHGAAGSVKNDEEWPEKHLFLARSHLVVWRRQGPAGEAIHLEEAQRRFEKHFERHPLWPHAKDWIAHMRCLLYLGELQTALRVAQQLVQRFDNHARLPDFHFYAGVICKALHLHDKASDHFFEAMQIGPPRFFSSSEIITVISRNLEEMNVGVGGEEDVGEAYRMVYEDLVQNETLPSDFSYEDWVGHASTWITLGDKCAMHEMFPLATDFYSLALLLDPDAFQRPALWYRMAKGSYLCHRSSDAQLAVQQALSRLRPDHPQYGQLVFAQTVWNNPPPSHFLSLLRQPTVQPILDEIGAAILRDNLHILRTQAIYRGYVSRSLRGLQGEDRYRFFRARMGVYLVTYTPILWAYPVFLTVRGNRYGVVRKVLLFDVRTNERRSLTFSTPLVPPPHLPLSDLKLSLHVRRPPLSPQKLQRIRRHLSNPSGEGEAAGAGEGDGEDAVSLHSGHESLGSQTSQPSSQLELLIKYTSQSSGAYVYKKVYLTFRSPAEGSGEVVPMLDYDDVSATSGNASQVGELTRQNSTTTSAISFPEDPVAAAAALPLPLTPSLISRQSTLRDLVLEDDVRSTATSRHDDNVYQEEAEEEEGMTMLPPGVGIASMSVSPLPPSLDAPNDQNFMAEDMDGNPLGTIYTNIARHVVLRRGFCYQNKFYLVQVINDQDITQLNFLQVNSNRIFMFLTLREYLPILSQPSHPRAAVSEEGEGGWFERQWGRLLQSLYDHPLLHDLIAGRESDDLSSLTHTATDLPADPALPPAATTTAATASLDTMSTTSSHTSSIAILSQSPDDCIYTYSPALVATGLTEIEEEEEGRAMEGVLWSCHARRLPHNNGAMVILVDPQNRPIFGPAFEVVESDGPAAGEGQQEEEEEVMSDLHSEVVPSVLYSMLPQHVLSDMQSEIVPSNLQSIIPSRRASLEEAGGSSATPATSLGGDRPSLWMTDQDSDMVQLRMGGELENDSRTATALASEASVFSATLWLSVDPAVFHQLAEDCMAEVIHKAIVYTVSMEMVHSYLSSGASRGLQRIQLERQQQQELLLQQQREQEEEEARLRLKKEQEEREEQLRVAEEEEVERRSAVQGVLHEIVQAVDLRVTTEEEEERKRKEEEEEAERKKREEEEEEEECAAYVPRKITSKINLYSRAFYQSKDSSVPPFKFYQRKQPFCSVLPEIDPLSHVLLSPPITAVPADAPITTIAGEDGLGAGPGLGLGMAAKTLSRGKEKEGGQSFFSRSLPSTAGRQGSSRLSTTASARSSSRPVTAASRYMGEGNRYSPSKLLRSRPQSSSLAALPDEAFATADSLKSALSALRGESGQAFGEEQEEEEDDLAFLKRITSTSPKAANGTNSARQSRTRPNSSQLKDFDMKAVDPFVVSELSALCLSDNYHLHHLHQQQQFLPSSASTTQRMANTNTVAKRKNGSSKRAPSLQEAQIKDELYAKTLAQVRKLGYTPSIMDISVETSSMLDMEDTNNNNNHPVAATHTTAGDNNNNNNNSNHNNNNNRSFNYTFNNAYLSDSHSAGSLNMDTDTLDLETKKRRLWAYAAYWQKKLLSFIKYHAGLNSNVYQSIPSIAQLTAYNIESDSLDSVQSLDSVTEEIRRFMEKHPLNRAPSAQVKAREGEGEASAAQQDAKMHRPPFWLLKKQLRILSRALSMTMTSSIYDLCASTTGADMEKHRKRVFIDKPAKPHKRNFIKENVGLYSSRTHRNVFEEQFKEQLKAQLKKKKEAESKAMDPFFDVTTDATNPSLSSFLDKTAEEIMEDKGTLSVEEMICALAETKGSVGEVILRLQDHSLEFLSEIQLVVASLDIRQMVLSFRGGEYVFERDRQPLLRTTFASSSPSPKRPATTSALPSATIKLSETVHRDDTMWMDAKKVVVLERSLSRKRMLDGLQTLPSRSASVTLADMFRQKDTAVLETLFDADEVVDHSNSLSGSPMRSLSEVGKRPSKATGLMILPKIPTPSERAGHSKLVQGRASFVPIGRASRSPSYIESTSPSRRVSTAEQRHSPTMRSWASRASFGGENKPPRSAPGSPKFRTSSPRPFSPSTNTNNAQPFSSYTTPDGQHLLDIEAIRENFLRSFVLETESKEVETASQPSSKGRGMHRSVSFADDALVNPSPSQPVEPSPVVDAAAVPQTTIFPAGESIERDNHISALRVGFEESDVVEEAAGVLLAMPIETDQPSSDEPFHLPKLVRKPTSRMTDKVLNELFNDYSALPTAVLNRRDERRVEVEETLLRSNKLYLRQPIERKIAKLTRMQSTFF